MPEPLLTGAASKVAGQLAGAALRRGTEFWRRNREGHNLTRQIAKKVRADARVHHEVREELAKALPDKLRMDPSAQGALALLLEGTEIAAAADALTQITARLVCDSVEWPAEFGADAFGGIVAAHAVESVGQVKATDREAAHVDAKYTRERIAELAHVVARDRQSASVPPSLLPPFSRTAGPLNAADEASLLDMLRASERRFRLVGRDVEMDAASAWLHQSREAGTPDHRAAIILGPGGAGKSRLAAEILALAETDGWTAGFLVTGDPRTVDWTSLSHPSEPLAVAVDYAEARRNDLQRLLQEVPVGREGSAPWRLILVVREEKPPDESWLNWLSGPWDLGPRAGELLAENAVTIISLEESLPRVEHRQELWRVARDALGVPDDAPEYLARQLFDRPLYVLLDAARTVVESDNVASAEPPTRQQLLDRVLRHERNYWTEARDELGLELNERQMNQVAVVATLVGGVSRRDFECALRSLPRVGDDDDLRRRVADWWCGVYGTGAGTVRGVEPDIVGEYQIVRALNEPASTRDQLGGSVLPDQLTRLIGAATLAGRQRILRVLTRIAATDESSAATVVRRALSGLLSGHLDEFLPPAFASAQAGTAGGIGEPLATTVASAVIATEAFELVASRNRPRDEVGRSLDAEDVTRAAALQVVRREIERVATKEYESRRWPLGRFLKIAAWAAELDLLSGRTDAAMGRIRELESQNPRPGKILERLYGRAGRAAEASGRWGDAEQLYRRSLDEAAALGEDESLSAYVTWHDLGDVASAQGDYVTAIEHYDHALEGKTRLRGREHPDTITTALALTRAVGITDVGRAFAMLDETAEELLPIASEESVRVRDYRPNVLLAAGRFAEREERWSASEDLYRLALTELESTGRGDSEFAYIIWHDLGDVASAQGDHWLAIERLERALAGKSRILGSASRGTVITLTRLAREDAKTNVDRALARLALARADLQAEGAPAEALLQVAEQEIEILSDARRFGDAAEATGRLQESLIVLSVREAVLDSAIDQTAIEPPFGANPIAAIHGALLAARVFGGGDPRLVALASRLMTLVLQIAGELVASQMGTSVSEQLMSKFFSGGQASAETLLVAQSDVAREIASFVPKFVEFVWEGIHRIETALDELAEDPTVSLLRSQQAGGSVVVARDRAVRRWLADWIFRVGPLGSNRAASVSTLFAVQVAAELGLPDPGSLVPEAWTAPDSERVAALQAERLASDLQAAGGISSSEADGLVREALPRALLHASSRTLAGGDLDEAEALAIRAQKILGETEALDVMLAAMINRQLGVIAVGRGDLARAQVELERAYEAQSEIEGIAHPASMGTLQLLTAVIAKTDADRALGLLRDKTGELAGHDLPLSMASALAEIELSLLVQSGRRDEARHTARRTAKEYLSRAIPAAVDQTGTDPIPDEAVPTPVAVEACLLALRLLAPGHPRFVALASELAELVVRVVGHLVIAELSLARIEAVGAAMRTAGLGPNARSSDMTRWLNATGQGDVPPVFETLADEIPHEALRREAVELADETIRTIAHTQAPEEHTAELANARAVTGWLIRTVVALRRDDATQWTFGAELLTFQLGLRLGVLRAAPMAAAERGIWLPGGDKPEIARALDDARAHVTAALQAAGDLDNAAISRLVEGSHALALLGAARQCELTESWDVAERLYQEALARLPALKGEDAVLPYLIEHDLGNVASARGNHAHAIDCYERALDGETRLLGAGDEETVATLLKLADELALSDIEHARERVQKVLPGVDAEDVRERILVWLSDDGGTSQAGGEAP
jgi:tetratricopeptide (TPR) repeat protein